MNYRKISFFLIFLNFIVYIHSDVLYIDSSLNNSLGNNTFDNLNTALENINTSTLNQIYFIGKYLNIDVKILLDGDSVALKYFKFYIF